MQKNSRPIVDLKGRAFRRAITIGINPASAAEVSRWPRKRLLPQALKSAEFEECLPHRYKQVTEASFPALSGS
jgi:hypothetical protein